ncbi:MAG: ATP-binding protein [Candidatus Limnocylindrales bacterium]
MGKQQVTLVERQVRFKVSTRLLDHLGIAMYSSVPKAISEIVVNGYDADANLVVVTSDQDHIVIEDNGSGMSEARIEQFLTLASGDKRRRGVTTIFHRDPIGAKGIGKLAGLGVARRIEVETWQDGLLSSFAIDHDEMRRPGMGEQLLDREPMTLRVRKTEDVGSGTRVTLRKLRPEARFVAAKVREHLAAELPLSDTFRVIVDGQTVRKDEVKGRRIAIRETDPVCGLIDGYVVVANAAVQTPGVLTTVRGRAVGGPSFFNLKVASRRYHSTDRITGQVEAAGLDVDDGTPTAIKTDREGFVVTHPRYEAYAAYMTARLEAIARELEDRADADREARKRAKLSDAVRRATDVLNAFTEHERRLFQMGGGQRQRGAHDEASAELAPQAPPRPPREAAPLQPEVEQLTLAEPGPKERPESAPRPTPRIKDSTLIPVDFGQGRLRFRSQVFAVEVRPLGPGAPECVIYLEEGLLVVNADHPSYEEAERAGWSEAVVMRAVATRLACDHSSTADEAYALLDEILRFAAGRERRKASADLAEAV